MTRPTQKCVCSNCGAESKHTDITIWQWNTQRKQGILCDECDFYAVWPYVDVLRAR